MVSAVDTLPRLFDDARSPFDLIFIDADKESYPEYLEYSIRLSRPGALIVADNVVRNGAIIEPGHPDSSVQGIRRFNELIALEKRINAVVIQTVGSKGYDGFAFLHVGGE